MERSSCDHIVTLVRIPLASRALGLGGRAVTLLLLLLLLLHGRHDSLLSIGDRYTHTRQCWV